MAKLQSSFKNMLLSLTLIALVAAAALAGVYMLTKDPIAAAMTEKQQSAIMQVLPEVEGDIRIAEAEQSNGVTLYKAYVGEEWIGTAVEASTEGNQNMPFGGTFRLMVGFNNVGDVVRYVVLEQAETPGLGANMTKEGNSLERSAVGKEPKSLAFAVSKEGGSFDALTGSTISSRAYANAVETAYAGYLWAKGMLPSADDAKSGATNTNYEESEAQKGEVDNE